MTSSRSMRGFTQRIEWQRQGLIESMTAVMIALGAQSYAAALAGEIGWRL